VQTVMYLATLFGVKEISWPDEQSRQSGLIVCILLIQFVAIGGAYLFSSLSSRFGNIKALIISIFVWMMICVCVYGFVYVPFDFYITAAFVGLVMGGIQSLSRSTYSKLLPETHDHASYFSFYDVCDKCGTVFGTLIFGLVNEVTGSMRDSILALIFFFIVGILLLLNVQKKNRIIEINL